MGDDGGFHAVVGVAGVRAAACLDAVEGPVWVCSRGRVRCKVLGDAESAASGAQAEFGVQGGVCLPAGQRDDGLFEVGQGIVDRGPCRGWGYQAARTVAR